MLNGVRLTSMDGILSTFQNLTLEIRLWNRQFYDRIARHSCFGVCMHIYLEQIQLYFQTLVNVFLMAFDHNLSPSDFSLGQFPFIIQLQQEKKDQLWKVAHSLVTILLFYLESNFQISGASFVFLSLLHRQIVLDLTIFLLYNDVKAIHIQQKLHFEFLFFSVQ